LNRYIVNFLQTDPDTGTSQGVFNHILFNGDVPAIHQENPHGIMVVGVFSDRIAAGVHKMQRVTIVPTLIFFDDIIVGVPDDHIP
jgi:hypothetical protein